MENLYYTGKEKRMAGYVHNPRLLSLGRLIAFVGIGFAFCVLVTIGIINLTTASNNYRLTHSGYVK